MIKSTLIPVSTITCGLPAVPAIHFADRQGKASKLTGPEFYSVHTRSNGLVTLTEYASEEEFKTAFERARITLGRKHRALGLVKGCKCSTCS